MIKVFGLSVLLTIPGVIHILTPEKFLFILPEWLPWKIPGIILTGVQELVLAVWKSEKLAVAAPATVS